MIYLFYGDDAFTMQEQLGPIKEAVGPADLRDVNITDLDGTQLTLDELVATCDTVPFLGEKRLVMVKGLLSQFEASASSRSRQRSAPDRTTGLGQWEGLPDYLRKVPETTDLVFVEGRLGRANPLLARIRSIVTVRTFPLPSPADLRHWIRRRATSKGGDIEPGAVNLLAETVGGNLQTLDNELEKLSAYRAGQAIRQHDVREVVSYTKEANIFASVDAMLEGRSGIAIKLAHQLLDSGRPPSYLLSMMARQVRLLLVAKDLKARGVPSAQIGQRLGLSDFPLRKTLDQEKGFTTEQLTQIHNKLLEADVSIKTGAVDEELALDLLITQVSSGGRLVQGVAAPHPRHRR